MKTSDEFKNEVYLRAKAEKARIKRRNRILLTAVPCIAIAVVLGVCGLTYDRMSMKESQIEDAAVQDSTAKAETQTMPQKSEDLTQEEKGEVALTEALTKTPQKDNPTGDNSFEVSLCMSEIFPLNAQNNVSGQTAVVNSKNELSAFIKNNSQLGFDEKIIKSITCYDDNFFKDNSLLIIVAGFAKEESEENSEVILDLNEKSININIKAHKSDKKEDLKIVFVPIDKRSDKPSSEINVSFS